MAGQLMLQKYGLGWTEAKLYDPELCVSSSIDLDSWFDRGPEPAYSRSPAELYLRQGADGTFVVTGAAWVDAAPAASQTLVVAFRRELGLRPSFVSAVGVRVVVSLLVGLGCALWGWSVGRRALAPNLPKASGDEFTELHLARQLARSRAAGRLALVALILAASVALWPALRAASSQLY